MKTKREINKEFARYNAIARKPCNKCGNRNLWAKGFRDALRWVLD